MNSWKSTIRTNKKEKKSHFCVFQNVFFEAFGYSLTSSHLKETQDFKVLFMQLPLFSHVLLCPNASVYVKVHFLIWLGLLSDSALEICILMPPCRKGLSCCGVLSKLHAENHLKLYTNQCCFPYFINKYTIQMTTFKCFSIFIVSLFWGNAYWGCICKLHLNNNISGWGKNGPKTRLTKTLSQAGGYTRTGGKIHLGYFQITAGHFAVFIQIRHEPLTRVLISVTKSAHHQACYLHKEDISPSTSVVLVTSHIQGMKVLFKGQSCKAKEQKWLRLWKTMRGRSTQHQLKHKKQTEPFSPKQINISFFCWLFLYLSLSFILFQSLYEYV